MENFGFRSAYILKQDSLPASYKSFLNKHGGKDPVILQGVKDIASGKPFTNLGAIEKYYKTMGVNVKLKPDMKVPCSVWNTEYCDFSFFFFSIDILISLQQINKENTVFEHYVHEEICRWIWLHHNSNFNFFIEIEL